jgi:hypothetical protein
LFLLKTAVVFWHLMFLLSKAAVLKDSDLALRDIWVKPVVPAENRCCSLHQLFLLSQAAVLKDRHLALRDVWVKPVVPAENSCCSLHQLFLIIQAAVLKDSDLVLRNIWARPVVPAENSCCSLHQLFLLSQAAVLKDSDLALRDIRVQPVVPAENSRCFLTPYVSPKQSCCSKGQWPCPKEQLGEAVYFWRWRQYLLFLASQAAVLMDPLTLREAGCSFGKQLMFLLFPSGQAAVPKKHPT